MKYVIDDRKRFENILRNENNLNEEKINEFMNILNPTLNITIIINDRLCGGYEFNIYDNNTSNKKSINEYNSYEKSLINSCFSDYIKINNSDVDKLYIEKTV